MATFLKLCTDLARESGAVGSAPTSVTGQTGRQLKCVNWILLAWETIQNSRQDWTFLRGDWQGSLTADQMTYAGASFSIDRFGEFLGDRPGYWPTTLYDPDVGQEQEFELVEIPFDVWKMRYDRGVHDAMRPVEYCIAPDRTIRFGSKPDKTYTVRGEYRKTPQVLAANSDEPDMPARFHTIIVWRAIMLMAGADEAVQALADARLKYGELYRDLVGECVPTMSLGGSLA